MEVIVFMKKFKLILLLLILFVSVSTVYADGNFTDLQNKVDNSNNNLEITHDYKFDSQSDADLKEGILINKTNYCINGNGHTIDASNQSRIFQVIGENITINNLVFINANFEFGSAIFSDADNITIKNSYFAKNMVNDDGGAIYARGSAYIVNSSFADNYAKRGAAIFGNDIKLEAYNCTFTSSFPINNAMVYARQAYVLLEKCSFANINSNYSSALHNDEITIVHNSKFINLHASQTAGAIGLKAVDKATFLNNTFVNVSSEKNGGALFIDTLGNDESGDHRVLIDFCRFDNCKSGFGGALLQLYGSLTVNNSDFLNNGAFYDGGVIYASNVDGLISYTLFENNVLSDVNLSNGGAIYADYSRFTMNNNHFVNNTKNAVYAYDRDLRIVDSVFVRNNEAVHGVFLDNCYLYGNDYANDLLILNDTDYAIIIVEEGSKIVLKDDELNITNLPAKFSSSDFGWVSPVKNQGDMNSCWAFGVCGALESALLKATGVLYDFSENNMVSSELKYSKYGSKDIAESSNLYNPLNYVINWLGMLPADKDTYDELGKISSLISSPDNIHILDVVFINPRSSFTDNDAIKRAIVDYGAVSALCHFAFEEKYYNEANGAMYYYGKEPLSHAVTVVGWDDTYSASNFVKTPAGDGAWIIKNSYGTDFGNEGFNYISYYDTRLFTERSFAFLINNTENYTRNYQTDLGGNLKFLKSNSATLSYKNVYQAISNDYIAAVGTYFNESNTDYTINIYVNDKLALTQNGVSPYAGYHTVKLEKNVPVACDDYFTVEILTKYLPFYTDARQHYLANTSFLNTGDGWEDLYLSDSTACLKVYALSSIIFARDLVKYYKNDSQFKADIGDANQKVIFEINGRNYTRTSNDNGIATFNVNLVPGNFSITTYYNNTSVTSSITVLSTLIAQDLVKYYRNASQFYISLVDGQGNPLPNKNITMNINGVFYTRLTNENGTAKLNINLPNGTYILTAVDPVTDLKRSYNITVLPVLTGEDIYMKYKDGTIYTVKLVDGHGNPLNGAKITFNINGVFYNRATNSSGIAKLNINLPQGIYIITSTYNQAIVSNKITISS